MAVKALEREREKTRVVQKEMVCLREETNRHQVLEKTLREQLSLTQAQLREETEKHQQNLQIAREELKEASRAMEDFSHPELRKLVRVWKAMNSEG